MRHTFYQIREGDVVPRMRAEWGEYKCREIGLKMNCAILPTVNSLGESKHSIPIEFAIGIVSEEEPDRQLIERMAQETIQTYAQEYILDYYCYRVPLEHKEYVEDETNQTIHQYYMRVAFFRSGDMIKVDDIAQWCSI